MKACITGNSRLFDEFTILQRRRAFLSSYPVYLILQHHNQPLWAPTALNDASMEYTSHYKY